ncbi:MAG: extracellular solute-binding protein [Propionibacteriaceae bacterium]|jgi:raffinose/stachyose/melibiose transport system substrate-binding protein|nr:extracellular solute-binding protein [Propionibacteriaceae bacterium]
MKSKKMPRIAIALVAAATAATALAACGNNNDDGTSGDTATLTWWHNMNTDPGLSYWQGVVADYEAAHDGVKIDMQVYQSEDLRNKLKTALQSADAPDLFQQWGGGELRDQVEAGFVKDITSDVAAELAVIGSGNAAGWQVDGKTYGLPFTLGIEGIYYNKDLFEQAGITAVPTTLPELDAAIAKLKEAGITPISLGGQDSWPAGHWYYNFALRECSTATMTETGGSLDFSDPCWEKAASDLKAFAETEPFNDGWITTSAQQGAGSSAGMLANTQVAMELTGIWESGVVGSLTPDQKVPEFLGWFPFPSISGGKGDPTAAMAGGDGFSCHTQAPPECVDFLKYILSDAVQEGYAATGSVPSNPNAYTGLTEPLLQDITDQAKSVKFTQLWMDVAFGNNVGTAINTSTVALLQGQLSAADFVKALQDAAATA